jgi:hypothetical protein
MFEGDRIRLFELQLVSGRIAIAFNDLERNATDSCCSYSNVNLLSILNRS